VDGPFVVGITSPAAEAAVSLITMLLGARERRKPWEGTRSRGIDAAWALAFRWLRRPDHTQPPTLCDALVL